MFSFAFEYISSFFFFSLQLDSNTYEQWRANIHQELEEDLQRQVQELLEETERKDRLAKLQRHSQR